jgi:hypothetical protein
MKKREIDHVLRAAGRITQETQFIIVGSQALHGKYPDLADEIERSAEGGSVRQRPPGENRQSQCNRRFLSVSRVVRLLRRPG